MFIALLKAIIKLQANVHWRHVGVCYGVFTRSSKRPAIHVYFEYNCWKFAGRLLGRVNTLLIASVQSLLPQYQFYCAARSRLQTTLPRCFETLMLRPSDWRRSEVETTMNAVSYSGKLATMHA